MFGGCRPARVRSRRREDGLPERAKRHLGHELREAHHRELRKLGLDQLPDEPPYVGLREENEGAPVGFRSRLGDGAPDRGDDVARRRRGERQEGPVRRPCDRAADGLFDTGVEQVDFQVSLAVRQTEGDRTTELRSNVLGEVKRVLLQNRDGRERFESG
jgi:hypothetical protein